MDMFTCMHMNMSMIIYTNLSMRAIFTNLDMRRMITSIQKMTFLILMINNPKKALYPLKVGPARLRKNGSDGDTHMVMDFIHTD